VLTNDPGCRHGVIGYDAGELQANESSVRGTSCRNLASPLPRWYCDTPTQGLPTSYVRSSERPLLRLQPYSKPSPRLNSFSSFSLVSPFASSGRRFALHRFAQTATSDDSWPTTKCDSLDCVAPTENSTLSHPAISALDRGPDRPFAREGASKASTQSHQ
jgi:hypothetical protein